MLFSLGLALAMLFTQAFSALPTSVMNADWPPSVTTFIERSENCFHFSGEFNGDGSARDAEINRRMDKLRCNALPHDLQTLRGRYRTDARVTARLANFDDDGMARDAETGI